MKMPNPKRTERVYIRSTPAVKETLAEIKRSTGKSAGDLLEEIVLTYYKVDRSVWLNTHQDWMSWEYQDDERINRKAIATNRGQIMCNETKPVNVKIPADLSHTGKAYWKDAKIDACIADIVDALQASGIDMRGSCCGHGNWEEIFLQDGRVLMIQQKLKSCLLGHKKCKNGNASLSGHNWHCPKCDFHLTSLGLCPECGMRYIGLGEK